MPVRNNVNTVEVLDAGNLGEFLAQARKAWTAAHPEAVGRRGRPSEQNHVFDACTSIHQQQSAKGQLTQGQLILKVKDLLGVQCPSADTVERHVKKWIDYNWTLDDLSPAYLRTKEGKEMCAMLCSIFNAFQKPVQDALQKQVACLPPGATLKDLRRAFSAQLESSRSARPSRKSR